MKGEHLDLLTGILIGTVIGGMYSTQLAVVLPIVFGALGLVVALKLLGLLK